MNSLDTPYKKRLRRIGYLLSTIFILVTTYVLFYYSRGYFFDFETKKFIKQGLFIVKNRPVDGLVIVDNKKQFSLGPLETQKDIRLNKGWHNFKISSEGYKTWSANFYTKGSDVTWIDYPVLLPNKISNRKIQSIPNTGHFSVSDNRKFVLNFYNKDNKFSILNYKITDTDVEPEDILLPELVSTDLAGAVVETVNWRGDSRKLILRLKKPDATTVHLFIDIKKPENAFIYEKEFFVTADKFIFDQTNSNNVYVILEQKLYQLNASTKSLSSVLVENSVDVSTNRDKTLIVTNKSDQPNKLYFYELKDRNLSEKPVFKITVPDGFIDFKHTKISIDEYLIVTTKTKTFVIKNYQDKNSQVKEFNFGDSEINLNPLANRFMLRNGSNFFVYDVEFNKTFKFSQAESAQATSPIWVDNWHFESVLDSNRSMMFEYTNKNQNTIYSTSEGSIRQSFLSDDLRYSIVLVKASESSELEPTLDIIVSDLVN
jgi:hypothetical protein